MPTAREVAAYIPPATTNLTSLPLTLSPEELPVGIDPLFHFSRDRLSGNLGQQDASTAPSGPACILTSAYKYTPCILTSAYDYPRAQALLSAFGPSRLAGPYIVSVTQPLRPAAAMPDHYLYQDLSSVPPDLVQLWVKEFMAQAQEPEFWKTRSKEQFILRLRTAIGTAGSQLPDFNKTIDWVFAIMISKPK